MTEPSVELWFHTNHKGEIERGSDHWPEHIHVSDKLVDHIRDGCEWATVGEGVIELWTANAGTAIYRLDELGASRFWEAELLEVVA